MSMNADACVIISGAGPAGSLAAWELRRYGISTLIFDKEMFPRYKVCGAGLTHKTLAILPFDISPVIHTTINSIRFSRNCSEVFTRTNEHPLIYCTMRDELDNFLLKKAIDAGSGFSGGEKVTAIRESDGLIRVRTSKAEYSSLFFIGADGASSLAARTFSLNRDIEWGMAWEAEVRPVTADLDRFSGTVFLDWGTFPGGYAWIFPKRDHFSVGIGGPARLAKLMPEYYRRFILSTKIPIHETISNRSHPLPVRIKKSVFHSGNVIVAGDAAGLTDALTGEGIYWAMKSGIAAARFIHEKHSGKTSSISPYSDWINENIMPEMMEAVNIGALFNAFPGKIHHWVRDSERVWKAFGKVLRGERSFTDVPAAFGRWQPFWKPACRISSIIGHGKERRYVRKAKP
jgi:geranylgeranyl reductase family protein